MTRGVSWNITAGVPFDEGEDVSVPLEVVREFEPVGYPCVANDVLILPGWGRQHPTCGYDLKTLEPLWSRSDLYVLNQCLSDGSACLLFAAEECEWDVCAVDPPTGKTVWLHLSEDSPIQSGNAFVQEGHLICGTSEGLTVMDLTSRCCLWSRPDTKHCLASGNGVVVTETEPHPPKRETFIGLDLRTGTALWHFAVPEELAHLLWLAVIRGDRCYLTTGERHICLELRSGKELFRSGPFRHLSQTSPAFCGRRFYSIDNFGPVLCCFDADDGQMLECVNLSSEFDRCRVSRNALCFGSLLVTASHVFFGSAMGWLVAMDRVSHRISFKRHLRSGFLGIHITPFIIAGRLYAPACGVLGVLEPRRARRRSKVQVSV